MLPHLYCDVMRTMTLGKTERVVPNTTKRLRANLEKLIVKLLKRMWKLFIITSNIFLSKLRRLPRVIHLYWKSSNISPFYIFLLRMIDYGRKVMHGGEILEPTWVVVPLLSRHRKWKTEWSGQRNKQPGKKRDDLLKMCFRVSPEKELQRWMRSGSTRSRCPLDWPGIDN